MPATTDGERTGSSGVTHPHPGPPTQAGEGVPDCAIVDIGYTRKRDLALELPPVPLQPVMSNEQWELVYARDAEHVE